MTRPRPAQALVRAAVNKSWPSEEEVRASGCDDAGDFVLASMEEGGAAHARFLSEHPAGYGKQLVRTHVCLQGLLSLLTRMIATGRGTSGRALTPASF